MVGSKQYSMIIGLKYRTDSKFMKQYNSHLLVSTSYDGTVSGYHVQTGKTMYQYKFRDREQEERDRDIENGILTMDMSCDGDTIMLAGEQAETYLVDQETQKVKATF